MKVGRATRRTLAGAGAGLAVLFAAPVVAGASTSNSGQEGSAAAAPAALADSGFRASTNGFSFENYGGKEFTDLTAAEMQALFGSSVCASTAGGTCTLSPEARAQMEAWNRSMIDGHCYGMSVTALMFYKHQLDPSTYGAETVPALELEGNTALQRRIALSFVYQGLESVQARQVTGTPVQVLRALIERLKEKGPESWSLGFYKIDRKGGHEVTPFKVVDYGNDQYGIEIYDNNYPGSKQVVKVDAATDTWTYTGATNPDEPPENYHGTAASKTLELDPTTPAFGVQPCPFCGTEEETAAVPAAASSTSSVGGTRSATGATATSPAGTREITLEASATHHGHLLITDQAGHQTGYRPDGTFVNQIPGATVHFPKLNSDYREAEEPVYEVPTGSPLTVTLDGAKLRQPSRSSLVEIGPAYETQVDGITLQPGERDTWHLAGNGPKFGFRPGRNQSPTIQLGANTPGADYTLNLATTSMAAGVKEGFELDPGRLVIDARHVPEATSYTAGLTTVTPSTVQHAPKQTLHVDAHQRATFNYTTW